MKIMTTVNALFLFCAATMAQTCTSLSIPQECESVLSIVRSRAERLKSSAV